MDWHFWTNIISMVWNGVESFAETKTNNWSQTNQKIVSHAARWANCMAKSARECIFENWALISKSCINHKMDWHSQTNIISMVWNGVESFAETKTNDWSETNWKIVPHASRWANCMAKSAREWIFENWALIYIYTILWAVKGRLHWSSPPTRPNGGPPRGPPIVFFHCPEWPWSDFFYYGKVVKKCILQIWTMF
jgi:hypothetical protein